jgi:hypothetical protein
MRITHLNVARFRSIESLDWVLPDGVTCLVGPGDVGKSSVLDAIELTLYPRPWFPFTESDFFDGDTSSPIVVEATLTDLPETLLRQEKFGLSLRGWKKGGELRDEPEDDDDLALTIRLTVDDSLEPSWAVVTDREPEGRIIAARDRERLGVLRIGDDVDRQLSWARGSSLARITDDPESVQGALASAHRAARDAVSNADLERLSSTAQRAGDAGALLGSHVVLPLSVGVDSRSLSVGTSALGLRQDGGVPARALGLGSRRLLALAVQMEAVPTGAVILIDEVEAGLEPHRLRHLLSQLARAKTQILMTSHSPTAVAELGAAALGVVRRDESGRLDVRKPGGELQSAIRALPAAILSHSVVVCEGPMECGMARALTRNWDAQRSTPLAWRGAVFLPGSGSSGPRWALGIASLQYRCAYWGDGDTEIEPSAETLRDNGVAVIRWDRTNTEHRIMLDVPEPALDDLWAVAIDEKGLESVRDQLAHQLRHEDGTRPDDLAGWKGLFPVADVRTALARAAAKGSWYKRMSAGERVGEVLAHHASALRDTELGVKLALVEEWAYGD